MATVSDDISVSLAISALAATSLCVLAAALIMRRKEIAATAYELQRPGFKWMFGRVVNLDRPWFRRLYDISVVGAAVVLLALAYALQFGPVAI